jgi:hypothetical protein
LRIRLHKAFRIGQRLAQLVEQVAQVGESLGFARVWPEEEGEMVAGLGRIAMQYKIRQEGLRASRI